MAADGTTRLPHPRPGRAAAASARLSIRQEKSLHMSQLTSIYRGNFGRRL